METVDPTDSDIVYEVKKKLAFHVALEILELEASVESDGSCNEEKDPEREWKGWSKAMKGRIQAVLLYFLESDDCHILVSPLLLMTRHGMHIPSVRISEDQI